MIARQIEKGHIKALDEGIKFLPLIYYNRFIFLARATGYQVPHAHYKLRTQIINFFDCLRENPTTNAASSVGNNGKLKVGRVILKFFIRPRFSFCCDRVLEIGCF